MDFVLIVNPELGWDSVVAVLDTEGVTEEMWEKVEKICKDNHYILIDWKSVTSVESFLTDY